MDDQINQAVEKIINQWVNSVGSEVIVPQGKVELTNRIRNHIYTRILFIIIDNLTEDQLQQIQGLKPDNPKLQEKIEEFAQNMPFALFEIEEQLNQDLAYFKQNNKFPPLVDQPKA